MALYALQVADHKELEKRGRSFRCATCTKRNDNVAKIRRCMEDRWDFTEKDGAHFPVYIHPTGPFFSFCPAKVQRDDGETVSIFQTLNVILELNTLPKEGGIEDQEWFWIDLISDFGPFRRDMIFNQRFQTVSKAVENGTNKGSSPDRGGGIGQRGAKRT